MPHEPAVRRVLVVDDDAPSRTLFGAVLTRLGIDAVVFAEDGEEALERFRADRFDLVLMDSKMPGMDGLEATRRIREHEERAGHGPVPIIGTTAHHDEDTRRLGCAAGMNDMLHKPVEMARVKSVVDRWAPAARSRDTA